MGKRIIQQARGHGSPTYRVRRAAYRFEIGYPSGEGKGKIVGLIHSPGHSAPLAKIMFNGKIFYNTACRGLIEGEEMCLGGHDAKNGNVMNLVNIPIGTRIYNIEARPGDGGKIARASGLSATIIDKVPGKVGVLLPSKKKITFDERCRATVGEVAGQGRTDKPIVKAGTKWYMKKARNKLWPRTSAVKMNAIDHPFGSGRGKRIKSKIAKNNSPAGARVGLLHPRRTGRRKR